MDNQYFQEMEDARQEVWEMEDWCALQREVWEKTDTPFVVSEVEPCDIDESEE